MIEATYVPLSEQLERYILSDTDVRFTDIPVVQFNAPLSAADRRTLEAHTTDEGMQLVEELCEFGKHGIAWIQLEGQSFTAFSSSREFPEIRQNSIMPALKKVLDQDVELTSPTALIARVYA